MHSGKQNNVPDFTKLGVKNETKNRIFFLEFLFMEFFSVF